VPCAGIINRHHPAKGTTVFENRRLHKLGAGDPRPWKISANRRAQEVSYTFGYADSDIIWSNGMVSSLPNLGGMLAALSSSRPPIAKHLFRSVAERVQRQTWCLAMQRQDSVDSPQRTGKLTGDDQIQLRP
jgi:hypothetical protein